MTGDPRTLAERILDENDVAHLATCEGDQPRVRPLNVARRDGLTLWIASYAHWGKVGQLRANPKIEVCVVDPGGAHVRIEGRGYVRDDPELRRQAWDAFPLMRRYFASADAEEYALIELVPDRAWVKDAWDLEYTELDTKDAG